MTQRMMDALHNLFWMDETLKSGYGEFVENLAHNSIWNAKNILIEDTLSRGRGFQGCHLENRTIC
jgi:hypothetical protein